MPRFVKFVDRYDEERIVDYGIEVGNGQVICACCGGIFEIEEIEILDYLEWNDVNVYDAIAEEFMIRER